VCMPDLTPSKDHSSTAANLRNLDSTTITEVNGAADAGSRMSKASVTDCHDA
jgi:hypothetical protein